MNIAVAALAAFAALAWELLAPLPQARGRIVARAGAKIVGLRLPPADDFPAEILIEEGAAATPLARTGAFTRRVNILFVGLDIYRVASYAANPRPAPAEQLLHELLLDGPPRAYALRFLRTVTGPQLREAFAAEIENCFKDVDKAAQAEPLRRFLDAFSHGAGAGETTYLAWLPGGRLFLGRNDPARLALVATDIPFARAVWRIWSAPTAGVERYQLVGDVATPDAATGRPPK